MGKSKVVVLLGAGATKACGGPLTDEILPEALGGALDVSKPELLEPLRGFLRDVFHVRRPKNYPSLPLFLSLVDNAISRGDQFHPNWPPAQMRQVREAAEYAIFSVLDRSLRDLPPGEPHGALMAALKRRCDTVTVISLNYDLIADNVLIEHATKGGSYPDYGVDIATSLYTDAAKTWSLYKLHGSLGWFYCPRCHRLDVRLSRSGVRMLKAGRYFFSDDDDIASGLINVARTLCRRPDCSTKVRPILITPTHLKDYRNPHIARVWHQAEQRMHDAEHAVVVGYSLPTDDLEVTYLLKRGLSHLRPRQITVIEHDPQDERPLRKHPVGQRYRALFGDVNWVTAGFADWVRQCERTQWPV